MAKNFRIRASMTETIRPGTAVWFRAYDATMSTPDLVKTYDLSWRVTGPLPDEPVDGAEQRAGDPSVLVLRTDGFDPGGYQVTCTRRRRHADGTTGAAGEPTFMSAPLPPMQRADEADAGGEDGEGDGDGLLVDQGADPDVAVFALRVAGSTPSSGPDGIVPVSLQRTATTPTSDQVLWMIIRNRTEAIGFPRYKQFIDGVMCGTTQLDGVGGERLQYRGTGAYELLSRATDAFLMQEMGVITPGVAGPGGQGSLGAGVPGQPSVAWADLTGLDPEQLALRETSRLGFRPSRQQLEVWRQDYFRQLRDENVTVLPYLNLIQDRLSDIPLKGPEEVPPNCYGILRSRLSEPLAIELIWSYWHEEGMLVQTMNAVLARFQNRRLRPGPDPLARLDIDPLRPLGNLIWGWAQEEVARLTVARRSAEYEHEYGLRLSGRALRPAVDTVDRRRKFVGAFHNLLNLAHVFFKEDDDTTVIADGFPVLNALRETHLLLAEGAHNQYGDLPSTARAEMLIMEWLLARPEMREFLGGRVMVPYAESWMDRVDTVKTLQRWTDVSVTYFRDMGVFGEQILLSVRFGNWSDVNDPQQAANWARYWRPEIQRYVHAYRAATGVDLTERVDATVPTVLLQRQLVGQHRR